MSDQLRRVYLKLGRYGATQQSHASFRSDICSGYHSTVKHFIAVDIREFRRRADDLETAVLVAQLDLLAYLQLRHDADHRRDVRLQRFDVACR